MTGLIPPKLGTDPSQGWQYYAVHLASAYVLNEYFLVSNYRMSMVTAERLDTEVGQWAREMRTQNYHELHSHALVGMWSAFEAGVEDALAAVIEHDRVAGCAAASRVKTKRNPYPLEFWPWTSATCLGIAQKLDRCAMQATTMGGTDLFARIQTAFSWVEVSVDLDHTSSKVLAEASRIRNLTLHRHGKVTESDASDVPSLKRWIGAVMPIDGAKFTAYYLAIVSCLSAITNGMSNSRHGNCVTT